MDIDSGRAPGPGDVVSERTAAGFAIGFSISIGRCRLRENETCAVRFSAHQSQGIAERHEPAPLHGRRRVSSLRLGHPGVWRAIKKAATGPDWVSAELGAKSLLLPSGSLKGQGLFPMASYKPLLIAKRHHAHLKKINAG